MITKSQMILELEFSHKADFKILTRKDFWKQVQDKITDEKIDSRNTPYGSISSIIIDREAFHYASYYHGHPSESETPCYCVHRHYTDADLEEVRKIFCEPIEPQLPEYGHIEIDY